MNNRRLKRKWVFALALIMFLPKGAQATPTQKDILDRYERFYHKIERQFHRLEKDAGRRFSKRAFDAIAWDRWVARWDEENLYLKGEAKAYEEWSPLLFNHVVFNLRHLTVIAYEYRRFFHSEESSFDTVEKDKQAFHESMANFWQELDYLREKVKLMSPA